MEEKKYVTFSLLARMYVALNSINVFSVATEIQQWISLAFFLLTKYSYPS